MSKSDMIALTGGRIRRRGYGSYREYLAHQASKLDQQTDSARKASTRIREIVEEYIPDVLELKRGMTVLCLGARLGGEVRAFRNMGCFAVGIDINPGDGNTLVVYGDFHDLEFADGVVDLIYTNSADHAYDLDAMVSECFRVLKRGGMLAVESKGGTQEPNHKKARTDPWDCLEWLTHSDLIAVFLEGGFKIIKKYRVRGFTPWGVLYQKP